MMNLFALLSGKGLISYLFGGSLPIMSVYLLLMGLDLVTGYTTALRTHRWVSAVNLYGLFTKFIAFSTIICAASLDKIAPLVGIDLPINVALFWTVLLIIYEISSILENAQAVGLKIGWLQKWLKVFEDKTEHGPPVDKDDQENNLQ